VAGGDRARASAERLARRSFSDAASQDSLSRIRSDISQLAELLQREPRLRKTFADIAVSDEVKRALLRELFHDRVHAATLSLVESLVGEEGVAWRLPAVLEDLAVEATLAQAEHEGDLAEVEDELFRFARLLEATPELRAALTNPVLPDENKRALLEDLLAGRVTDETGVLVRHVVSKPGDPVARIQELADRAASLRNRVVALARTAVAIDDGRRDRLARALSRATGRDVDLEVVVEPEILGGVVARIGDEVIDGTVRRRLEMALEQLAG
jgi:F-type H+-transporting ATPase subunit delta